LNLFGIGAWNLEFPSSCFLVTGILLDEVSSMSNSLGQMFRITSFGESHGQCIGVVIDGCPAGLPVAVEEIQRQVDRRKPIAGTFATARTEPDKVQILSGIFNGLTTGAPICMIVTNQDVESGAYARMASQIRPGHADYTAFIKYGGLNDFRGGGRFSGRITAGFVMAGAIARKLLQGIGVEIIAHTSEIGGIKEIPQSYESIKKNVDTNLLHCADPFAVDAMLKVIEAARKSGDSVGGVVSGMAVNVPAGLGEPVFDTLDGELAKSLLAIPAVKGVGFGSGFNSVTSKGSINNDQFIVKEGNVGTVTNNAGGILGGISNGEPILLDVAIKPTPSISLPQNTIDIRTLDPVRLEIQGRHDACIVPRVVPVVETMMALTLCDFAIRAGLIPQVLNHDGKMKSHGSTNLP
jgi:chorismate synthase